MRGGRASVITLDWPEIQEDIQVEPKVGSTLSIEDEFHRMGAQTFFQTAMAAPHVFDIHYAAKAYAATIPNIDATKAVLPPAPPPEPPPKVQANINVPLDKMPADVVNQLLPLIGLMPSKELEHIDTLNAVTKLGESADAAAKLEEPAVPEVGAKPDSTAGVRRTAASRV
jgi:hypothetical protein